MTRAKVVVAVGLMFLLAGCFFTGNKTTPQACLWDIYERSLKNAKYVDLTHTINPSIPVWHGFGPSKFSSTIDPSTKRPYTYEKDGFEATHYDFSTDQLGTQLDPPAHWNPYFPAIDELPATYTIGASSKTGSIQPGVTPCGSGLRRGAVHACARLRGLVPPLCRTVLEVACRFAHELAERLCRSAVIRSGFYLRVEADSSCLMLENSLLDAIS
jgi:Putative cyclase